MCTNRLKDLELVSQSPSPTTQKIQLPHKSLDSTWFTHLEYALLIQGGSEHCAVQLLLTPCACERECKMGVKMARVTP